MLKLGCLLIVFKLLTISPRARATVCSYNCPQRYTTTCGFLGLSRCTRYRDRNCYQCCSGWTGSTDSGCSQAICFGVTTCPNGGSCTNPDSCTNCNRGYYSPRCDACSPIANCLEVFCSSSSDQKCDRCDGEFGPTSGNAFQKSGDQRQCIKQCSWRSDSTACYPGSCSNFLCACSPGFSGTDCRTMSEVPVISEHRVTLIEGTTTVESPTVQGSTATVYTNLRNPRNLRINWISSYRPSTTLPNPSAGGHPYIESVGIGLISAQVSAYARRVGTGTNVYESGSQECTTSTTGNSFNADSPATDLVSCEFTFNVNAYTPQTGDVLRSDVESFNGGVLKLYNRDFYNLVVPRYYTGRSTSNHATITFDFDEPYHCVNAGCRNSMLHAGNDVTTQARITITWQSWDDSLSGIKEYDLQVRQLSGSHGNEMTEIFDSPAVYSGVTSSGHAVTLPHVGVYSIILSVIDNAGNAKLSRRFVFFDDDPNDVTIQNDNPMRILSASSRSNYVWQTNLNSGGTTSVEIQWTNRFINLYYVNQGLLKPIGSYIGGNIESNYDQNFGQRGRAAISNTQGITEFRVLHDIDHSGGRTTITVSNDNSNNWSNEGTNTQETYDLTLVDGDSIRFWVEARDLTGHFVRDSVLVHADSSPPVIEDFWLVRDGEVNLAVHSSADLHEMSVEFRTFDIHSGVRTIHWRLWDPVTETEYGSQTIPARQINPDTEDCDPVSCMCVPVGDCYAVDYGFNPTFHIGAHDTDYFITLTVTNHARLITTKTIRITVDTSGPQVGVVNDGIRGSNEVDFQEGNDLSAHWEGFFDKESGVKFYQYLFDDSCWMDETSIGRVKDEMTRTTSTHASWTAPSPGQYYVTVIAYNRALEPSEAVCSDGVVIDTSPPELTQIAISYARMWPGLAKDAEGRVWFINEHRRKMELMDASSDCSAKAGLVDDLSVYPEMSDINETSAILQGDLDCLWISAVQQKFYLPTDKHLTISWTAEDTESSIYDYEVGYSSSLVIDFFTSVSTSGHDHFMLHHPHFSHGSVLHVTVLAINKAQISTSKVIGPIIVDTTPPMFVGRVSVHVEDEYLIAEWGDSGFIDDEDTSLRYQVAIGSTPGGTETLPFQEEKDYKIGPCSSQTSCAAFSLADLDWHLHGDHEYYVSIRAQNGAGLATVGTSSVYRHIVQLPSLGVVLDVAPPGEEVDVDFGVAKDIDVQMNTTSISARWFGFEHPHLDINYEIAVGSEGGPTDVSDGFINVGNVTFYRLHGLDLMPLMTYFVTVRANSEAGSVTVTSDGVKVIQEGQALEGAVIRDGLGCSQDAMSVSSGLSHHSSVADQPCQDDITYQSSTSDISARWTIPEMLQPFVTSVLWAVEQEIEVNLDDETTTMEWITLLDDQDLGMAFQHVQAGSGLHSGAHYRSKVQFCHVGVCFQPIVSDGFWVLSQPPEVGQVTVGNIETTQGRTEISVVFQPFAHDYVRHDNQQVLMDFYEWSIAEDGSDGALLSPWMRIQDLVPSGDVVRFTASYSGSLDLDVCLRLSVRGYNKAGLSSIASTEIVDCDDASLVVPHTVIDADHEVNIEQNAMWPEPDKNYISSTSSLSAVWPTLRHRAYTWAAILDTGSTAFGNLDDGLQYPCDHPRAKACGKTDKEFVNVPNLVLEHGMRYRICIHADEMTLEHELWNEQLPAVSSCSDGVVIDTTPPTPGSVWIGWDQHQTYQSSVSELVLHWESFTDIEEHGMARHHSGIKHYEYAIGSMRGGGDVKEFTRVGITNGVIVHSLRLQNGHKYYATVRATDFVGLSSQAISDVIVIDTSSPVISAEHTLDVGGSFIRSTTSISASWENVFSDQESGVAYYEWALGSHPGHADIMPFTRESTEIGVSDPSQPLLLQEGHSYFISVKAINTVGLITLKSYGAFTVDATPPLAGHVFDGNPVNASANHRDRDFQEDRTVIRAFWEGFHDPHSAIVGYSWRAGICSGCSDVIPEQHVGLDTYVIAENLNLVPGLTYYVTVTACNAADLCTSVTSDGVTVDDSPPVAGRVYDGGSGGGDISYQSSRLELRAHWWGFHDPHSGLSHYEWHAGMAPGAEDILPSTRIELSEDALVFLSDSDKMPANTDIYVTVRAYNQLGMWIEATSNGFRVDSSPPDVMSAPAVDQTLGMAVRNTQVLQDLIRFSWKFSDPESGIKDQFVSVSTHRNGDVNIHPIKIAGSELDHTFTDLTLHEGSRYVITVVACNFAGLCTQAKTEPLLVDGSPPSVGTFAVDTESAANLERHHITWINPNTEPYDPDVASPPYHTGWMTWVEDPRTSLGSLALAWLGFADIHSGISHYLVSIGRTYSGSELTPSGPVRVDHSYDGMSLDEGIAQTAIIPLEGSITDLTPPYLYISIWAVNGVGLPSNRHHSTFELSRSSTDEGALVLLRQCSPATCEGHCACAPIDKACAPDRSCNDVTDSNPNTEIEVLDVLDLMHNDINTMIDIDDTATQYMAGAVWRVTEQKGLDIKWFEWSIGDDSSSNPSGVFDAGRDRIWFDVGQDNKVIIMLNEDQKLSKGVKYHVFVRAWYDATTYAVFRSDGITPDITPPKISTIRGTKIKDLARSDARKDTDYLTNPSTIFISWEGVFLDEAMSQYQVSLSTYPGGEDIRQFADHVFPASVSSTPLTSLNLPSGLRYYSNVRAFNKAGLHTLRSSDGFVVDTRRPDPGLVFDGIDLHDVEYQNSSTVISASWHGFVDLESYIDHYEWCVGQTPSPTDDGILPCTSVGIHLSASKTLAVPLTDGIRYYSKISAMDAAGLQSESFSSDGFVVDTTPPEPLEHILLGENLIQNPSFEMMLQEPDNTDMEDIITTVNPDSGSFNETMTRPTKSPDINATHEAPTPSLTESLTVNATDSYPTSDTNLTTAEMPFTTSKPSTAIIDVTPDELLGQWIIASNSQTTVVASDKKIAQDGRSYLSLHGSISQTFHTSPGSHYQVVVFASHAVLSHNPLLNQEGRIEAPGLNRVFRLYDRPTHGHSDQSLRSIQWHQHSFYFTASDDVSTLTISSVGESNGILLDKIQVRPLTTGPSSGDGSVEVHTQFIHSWSSIQAKWHFIDPESPIVDYSWAIGTTRGGTQLQSFTSVGLQTYAINTDLNMAHGSYVHITVMARNAADLIAIATSDPILIDLTPPLIYFVSDGGDAKDVDFSADDDSLTFSWSASDPESGIDHCEWAVGSEPGFDDILPSSSSPDGTSTVTTSLSQAMVEGQRLYVTVTCYNHAEKSSWKSSDGVTIVTVPPSSSGAVVNVKTLSETQYETRDGYQSQRDSLKGSWDGFMDPFGIQSYECHLSGPDAFTSWTPCGSTSETHLDWSGLSLVDDATYSLSVRAVNHAGLTSQAISGNFTLKTAKPSDGASGVIRSTWLGDGTVDLAWDGLFSPSSSLVYEVSLGTIPGGSDIMQWVETMETDMRVSTLAPFTDYHLTLTAINAAGLSQTVNKIINSE
ncbi:uncharacterized protein LOC119724354 isoform X2 [Patiria miniata]|uniref:Fibronectin type-III domain-containing protein n=1 Tax=Patiria miniata TaxID=46514 RepID=A0A913ZJQ2_PATMI|nr:uncharacterized protein LOC119724354 isoform X1 [Patiria miniata]XP_038051301.1 uncharacterized protein LOC119724354 isoform X2 [Patiria miniata]